MKTEPTEALKYADKELSDIKIVYSGATKDSKLFKHKDLVCAFEQGQSSPKIKQLEWEKSIIEVDGSEWIESHYIFGQFYEIKNCSNHYFILYMVDGTETTHLSLNEAKSAAQIDFEKRIKECLL